MPLDPWIIEEILKREKSEREKKEEQDRPRVEISIDEPGERHETPSERKPGHEMPDPNEPVRPPVEKKEDEPRRGVDTFRINGDDEDDDTIIRIDIGKPQEEKKEEPAEEAPAKKPD